MTSHAFRALVCACLLPVGAFAADNLVFNGGFELGTAGSEQTKNLQPSSNPNYVFEGDATAFAPLATVEIAAATRDLASFSSAFPQ